MNLPFFIAKRYLVSKKKQNIINIISGISIAGIVVGTMAIIIIISVLNGFNDLFGQFYGDFDPDLKITPKKGKMFLPEDFAFNEIKSHPSVLNYSEVIEEMALLKYGDQIYPCSVKGVPGNYRQTVDIDSLIVDGEYFLEQNGINYAVIGRGVAYNLGIGLSFTEHIMVYVPKKGKRVYLNPETSINHNYIFPSAIFAVLDDIDSKYIFVSYDFAVDLFESGNQVSAVELKISDTAEVDKIQREIKQMLGDEFHVKNKIEQHDIIFKTMKSEKFWVFILLVFVLILSSGNMIGNLTLLFIDKKDDIMILQSMGAPRKLVKRIFLFQGWMITLSGAILGTLLGILLCWLQIRYELITFPAPEGAFAVPAYPVKLVFTDILLAILTVIGIGIGISLYPVKIISQKYLQ